MNSSFDYYKQVESPDMYLCNPDQRFLCALTGENRHLTLRFNDLSELTFTVPKISGTEDNYDLIETKRLIFLDKIGWFQITNADETQSGDKCYKSVTAKSHQVALKDRGFVTEKRVYMFYNPNDPTDSLYDSQKTGAMPSVVGQMYQQLGIKIALNISEVEPTEDKKDWTLIYIDPILKFNARSYSHMYEAKEGSTNVCRSFEENKELNGYDFIFNKAEGAFEVVFEFDFLYHTIKVKTLDDVTKSTNIYLSFDNVMNTLTTKEKAEDIVTVMSCNGDNLDIRTVNPMGANYIVDFEYYKKAISDDGRTEYPWMSKELIDALDDWEVEYNKWLQDDDNRTGHTKGYESLIVELQALYEQKSQSDAELQAANLMLMDMENAYEQYREMSDKITKGEETTNDGSEFTHAETVKVGKKSMLPASSFYSAAFTEGASISGHTTPPQVVERYVDLSATAIKNIENMFELTEGTILPYGKCVESLPNTNINTSLVYVVKLIGIDGKYYFEGRLYKDNEWKTIDKLTLAAQEFHYELYYTDTGTTSTTALDLIKNYIDADEADTTLPLYFTDGDNRSFCKILVDSEVGLVKDANDNISENGVVEVRGVMFNVNTSASQFTVTPIGGSAIMASQANGYFIYDGRRYRIVKSADGIVSLYSFYVSGFERYTTYASTRGNGGWQTIWYNHINDPDNGLFKLNNDIQGAINLIAGGDGVEGQLPYIADQCNIQKFIQRRSQSLYGDNRLYEELTYYWIEGDYTNDSFGVVDEDQTNMSKRIELAKELMAAGRVDLSKCAQPKFEMVVDAINFTKIIEFQQFTNELTLGRKVTIEKEDGVYYYPALMTIEYDLDIVDSFSMTFSNASKPGDTAMTFADLIKESISGTRTVAANWSNLMDYSRNKENIASLIDEPLDRTLRAAKANMSRQAFIIDDHGILGRKYTNDSSTVLSDEQLRIMNNVIIFTDDNWETSKTALGKVALPNGGDSYGLVAETIIGNLILGDNIVAANNDGTVVLTGDGIAIKNKNNEVVFEATNNGDITVKNYVTNAGLTNALDAYVTSDSLGFNISSTSTLSSQLAGIYATSSEVSACAQKTEGTTSSAFSYKLDANGFYLYNGTTDPVFKCDPYGVEIHGSGSFTGEITATSGRIASLTINGDALENIAGNNKFVIDSSGLFFGNAAKYLRFGIDANLSVHGGNIEALSGSIICNDLRTNTLKITDGKIGYIDSEAGGYIDLNYNFGTSSSTVSRTATLTKRYVQGGGETSYKYEFTVNVSGVLLQTKEFNIEMYYNNRKVYEDQITVSAGQSTQSKIISVNAINYVCKFTASGSDTYTFTQSNNSTGKNIAFNASLCPIGSGTFNLGSTSNKWNTLYATTGAIETSDQNEKHDISILDGKYIELFDALTPVSFRLNNNTSNRIHTGFLAQDVRCALENVGIATSDFAGYCEWENEGTTESGLRYTEFIAILAAKIQQLSSRVHQLETELIDTKENKE